MSDLEFTAGSVKSPEGNIEYNEEVPYGERIFDLLLRQDLLLDEIQQKKDLLLKETIKETEYESKLWTETNFSQLKLSNKEMREAYVNGKMGDYISKTGKIANEVKTLEKKYDLLSKKINILALFMQEKGRNE